MIGFLGVVLIALHIRYWCYGQNQTTNDLRWAIWAGLVYLSLEKGYYGHLGNSEQLKQIWF